MKFCPSCGAEITANSKFCKACGANLEGTQEAAEKVTVQSDKKTNGLSIAALVLGCIAMLWALVKIVSLGEVESAYRLALIKAGYGYYGNSGAVFFGFCIGYTLLSFTPGLLALIFGLRGNGKKKNPLAIAGAILGLVALVASIFMIIYIAATVL